MSYQLTQTPRFTKALKKLDRPVSRRILLALYELIELDDPIARLKPLQHELGRVAKGAGEPVECRGEAEAGVVVAGGLV